MFSLQQRISPISPRRPCPRRRSKRAALRICWTCPARPPGKANRTAAPSRMPAPRATRGAATAAAPHRGRAAGRRRGRRRSGRSGGPPRGCPACCATEAHTCRPGRRLRRLTTLLMARRSSVRSLLIFPPFPRRDSRRYHPQQQACAGSARRRWASGTSHKVTSCDNQNPRKTQRY